MVDPTNAPPRALLELARTHTTGDVSTRHHVASREHVLDRLPVRMPVAAPRRPPRIAIGLAWAIGALALGGLGLMGATGVAISARRPSHVAAPSAPPPLAAPGLKIEASPAWATIEWDGERLPNPASIERAPDGRVHHVRVSAPGFVSQSIDHTYDSANTSLSVGLDRAGPRIAPQLGAREDALRALEPLSRRFWECWNEGLTGDEAMRGSAVLALAIGAEGKVTAADVATRSGLSPRVGACLAHVATDASFGPSSGPTTLRVSLAFGEGP